MSLPVILFLPMSFTCIILSSNSIKLPYNIGSFVIGSAYFANEEQEDNKTTTGGFLEYSYKRLKLNAQIGESKYSGSNKFDTSIYLIPEFKISDSLYLFPIPRESNIA